MERERVLGGLEGWDRAGAESVLRSVNSAGRRADFGHSMDRFDNTLARIWKKENRFLIFIIAYVLSLFTVFAYNGDLNFFLRLIITPIVAVPTALFYMLIAFFISQAIQILCLFISPSLKRPYESKRGQFDSYVNYRNKMAKEYKAGYSEASERAEMERFMATNPNYKPGAGRQWATKI